MPILAHLIDDLDSSNGAQGLFWDECVPTTSSDFLWDSIQPQGNAWTLEPALSFIPSTDVEAAWHGDAESTIRFHNLKIRNSLAVDTRYKHDSSFVWKSDRAAAGRIDEAYLQYDWHYGFVRFGRANRNWGPFMDQSLVLSDNPYSYDALEWQLRSSLFEFRHLVAIFPYQYSQLDAAGRIPTNRYLAAHSLALSLGRFGTLGITETVIFVSPTGSLHLSYLNPVSIYSVINTNWEGDANLMVAFGWKVWPCTKKITLRGEVIIDDIQIDNKTASDGEPNHWGINTSASMVMPSIAGLSSRLTLHYTYLSRWIYTVAPINAAEGQRYTYLGKSLGFPETDGDQTELSLTTLFHMQALATIGLRFKRHGQNNVDSNWPNRADGSLGYRTEPHIGSGITEKTFCIFGSGTLLHSGFADVNCAIDGQFIKNKNHIPTSTYTFDPRITLGLSLHKVFTVLTLPD